METYDPHTHTGFLRHLALRYSHNAQHKMEVMVNFVTSPCEIKERLVPLANEIRQKFSACVCVLQSMTDSKANVACSNKGQRLLAGERMFIEHELGGLSFKISPDSFFQTNSFQLPLLYEQVLRLSNIRSADHVLDLFCGTGTIGLYLSKSCASVTGIEVVPSAIKDAQENAKRNGIENANFVLGDLEKLKKDPAVLPPGENVDVIIVDPPRGGLHRDLVKYLVQTSARRIVYVSCNPATQARDILALQEQHHGKFFVEAIQPIDMFPHTPHIESVIAIQVNAV